MGYLNRLPRNKKASIFKNILIEKVFHIPSLQVYFRSSDTKA